MESIVIYRKGVLEHAEGALPQESPLHLTVNGRDIATLVASPHDLRFLVTGFLRLQGFVDHLADFLMLSVCEDFGIANVRIRGELPEQLRPVLTSGCGTAEPPICLALSGLFAISRSIPRAAGVPLPWAMHWPPFEGLERTA